MTINKVSFTKTFPVGMYWEKAMMEAEIVEGEDPVEAIKTLRTLLDGLYGIPEVSPTTTLKALSEIPFHSDLTQDQNTLLQIDSCEEVIVLETYRLIVRGKPELEDAYNKKMQHLLTIKK